MIKLGITGAHRTGKTVVAKEVSEKLEIGFITSSASQVFRDMGYSVSENYPLEIRVSIQEEILRRALENFRNQKESFITDRTPIDFAAYMLADVQRAYDFTKETDLRVEKFIDDCLQATTEMFDGIVLIEPGIPLKQEDMKLTGSFTFQTHIAAIMRGLIVRKNFDMDIRIIDFTHHLKRVINVIDFYKTLEERQTGVEGIEEVIRGLML